MTPEQRLSKIENLLQSITEIQARHEGEIGALKESQKKTDEQLSTSTVHEPLVGYAGKNRSQTALSDRAPRPRQSCWAHRQTRKQIKHAIPQAFVKPVFHIPI